MWNSLEKEIGFLHLLDRNSVNKYEVYIDLGLTLDHVFNMSVRLSIDIKTEGDLIWIAYVYCIFLIKYSDNSNTEMLDKLLLT